MQHSDADEHVINGMIPQEECVFGVLGTLLENQVMRGLAQQALDGPRLSSLVVCPHRVDLHQCGAHALMMLVVGRQREFSADEAGASCHVGIGDVERKPTLGDTVDGDPFLLDRSSA